MDFDFAGRKVVEKEDGGAGEYDPAMVRIQNSNRRDRRDLLYSMNQIQSGTATCSEGFVTCFLRVPRLLGCTAATMLPKQVRGTFRKQNLQNKWPPHPV